jgi:hypothetical protein
MKQQITAKTARTTTITTTRTTTTNLIPFRGSIEVSVLLKQYSINGRVIIERE